MPFVDFRTQPIGGRPNPWPIAGFTVRGMPGVEIRNTSPTGANGVTAYKELLIELPEPAANLLVDIIVGNHIVVEVLDVAGLVVGSSSFLAGTGPAVAVFSVPGSRIQRIRMVDSGTEDRLTLVFSS